MDPHYPDSLRKQREEGAVILQGIIEDDGSISDITVLKNPSAPLTKLAIAAFQQWRYKPALCDGTPLRVYVTSTFTFSLTQ